MLKHCKYTLEVILRSIVISIKACRCPCSSDATELKDCTERPLWREIGALRFSIVLLFRKVND
jgi:hypothetical protein